MSGAGSWYLVQQLAIQLPVFLVYLAGAILGLALLDRARLPAILCATGCALMLLASLAVTSIQFVLLQRIGVGSMAQYAMMSSAVGFVGMLARTVGTALVVAAVFIGRRRGPDGQA